MPAPNVDFNPTRPIRSTETWTLNVHIDGAFAQRKSQSPVDFWAEMAESVVDMAESVVDMAEPVVEATETLWLPEWRGSNGKGAERPARSDAAPGTGAPHYARLGVSRLSDFRNQSCAISPVHVTEPPATVRSGSQAAAEVVPAAASPGPATVDQRTVIESRRRRWLVAIAMLVIGLGVLLCLAAVLLGASANRRSSIQVAVPPAPTAYNVVMAGGPHSDGVKVAPGKALGPLWKAVDARQGRANTHNDHREPRDAPITAMRRRGVFT